MRKRPKPVVAQDRLGEEIDIDKTTVLDCLFLAVSEIIGIREHFPQKPFFLPRNPKKIFPQLVEYLLVGKLNRLFLLRCL